MRKLFILFVLLCSAMLTQACTGSAAKNTPSDNARAENADGKVIPMDKALFISKVCDYEKSEQWTYRGSQPAIIDLYADWCGPCRMTSPIMQELAKEYAGQIVIYKVDVDKERELAALFNATSIPLFVFIPQDGMPQLFRGAADKATYKRVIDGFLLKKETPQE